MSNNILIISVIIPTYNRAKLIKHTIESFLNQSYSHFEIIVVDDGSTDNTEELINSIEDDRIKYFKIQNSERGHARNFGAKQSKGKYLCFFDSDDIAFSHHLETASKIINKNEDIPIFHLGYETMDGNNKNTLKRVETIKQGINHTIINGNLLSCNAVFIRRDIFMNYFFNEDRIIAGLEDWELWLRISAKYEMKHFPIITSLIIQHENRSVLQTEKDKLIQRIEKFMQYILNNADIIEYYKDRLPSFRSSCYTYISLHIALTKKHKKTSVYYLIKGLIEKPLFIFQRRFFAIIKHLLC